VQSKGQCHNWLQKVTHKELKTNMAFKATECCPRITD